MPSSDSGRYGIYPVESESVGASDAGIYVGQTNTARNNNIYNFAHSGLVSVVPRGVGFITLGYDNIEVVDNVFEDHSTADKKLDPYTEGLHIHDNVMRNSGYDLPPPDLEKTLNGEIESVLPTLIGLVDQDLSILTPQGLLDILGGLLNFPSDTKLSDPAASNTGYYLDVFRAVDAGYGICKKPTALSVGACLQAKGRPSRPAGFQRPCWC